MRNLKSFMAFLLGAWLLGCGALAVADAAPGRPAASAQPAQGHLPADSINAEYLIHPTDLIDVQVLQAPEMARSVRVDSQGNISLPLIGVVKAAGLTSYQLERTIVAKLSEDLLRDPQVTVFIKEFTSQKITIQGLVKNPGVYNFSGKPSLLQAISMGGGLTEKADPTRIKIISRPNESSLGDQAMIVNADWIQKEGKPDPVLKSGDIVVVPEADPIVIDGAVNRPGVIYSGGKVTLMQVISMSGGLSAMADSSDVLVFSVGKDGRKTGTVHNFDDIRMGRAPDPVLLPGDQVVVDKSALRAFIGGVFEGFRGLGLGLGNPMQ